MDIKVITFDLDGVYFPNGKANFLTSLLNLGVSQEEAKRVFFASPQMNVFYKNGKVNDETFWTWAVNEWKLKIPWQDLVKIMIDGYEIDESINFTIKELRQNGYKTAICTNNFPARINGLQEKFGFLENFDIQILSYQVGESKPNLLIFKELIKKSDVPASQIIYSDDNIDCVNGAKQAGITTFLYEGFGKYLDQLRNVGVKV